jgi:hypothetical protein
MSAILVGLLMSGLLAAFLAAAFIMFFIIQAVFKNDQDLAKLREKQKEFSEF